MSRSLTLSAFKENYLSIKQSLSAIGDLALYDQLMEEAKKKYPDYHVVRKHEEFKAIIMQMSELLDRAGDLVKNNVGNWK